MTAWLDWFTGRMEGLAREATQLRVPKWAFPLLLFVLGAGALTGAWVFAPGEGQQVLLWGEPLNGRCAFLEMTGQPCPSCGMTRSWVYSARGDLWRGFLYNPAGATLFWWLVAGGLVGGARLATGNAKLFQRSPVFVGLTILGWMVFVYFGLWLARLGGVNPLPM